MQYLLLVIWDRAQMDASPEPAPGTKEEPEGFPWLDDLPNYSLNDPAAVETIPGMSLRAIHPVLWVVGLVAAYLAKERPLRTSAPLGEQREVAADIPNTALAH